MATFAFYTQGRHPRFKSFLINKTFFFYVRILKANTSLFPAAKALKHNKRQEKTKGTEPFTNESPKPTEQSSNPSCHPLLLPAGRASCVRWNKAVLPAQAACTAALSYECILSSLLAFPFFI